MKFKDFQAPVLFSITFKVLNLGEKFKYFQGCMGTLEIVYNCRKGSSIKNPHGCGYVTYANGGQWWT